MSEIQVSSRYGRIAYEGLICDRGNGGQYEIRRRDVLHRIFHDGARAGGRSGGAGLRQYLGSGTLAYPGVAQDAISGWRRAPQTIRRRDGSVRGPRGRGERDEDDQAWDG